jgi:hypothetical protein
MEAKQQPIDDSGTGQAEAQRELNRLLFDGFNGRVDELAIALGRDEEAVSQLLRKAGTIDDDLAMKVRGVAGERGVNLQ